VSPTAATSGLSATAGDSQILLAPDPGTSPDAGAFGIELRDAAAVSQLPRFPTAPQVLNGGKGTTTPNPDANQTDWNGGYLPAVPIPTVNPVSLPLNFSLPTNTSKDQPVPAESSQSEIDPQPSAPASQMPAGNSATPTLASMVRPRQSTIEPAPPLQPATAAQSAPVTGSAQALRITPLDPLPVASPVVVKPNESIPQNSSTPARAIVLPEQPNVLPDVSVPLDRPTPTPSGNQPVKETAPPEPQSSDPSMVTLPVKASQQAPPVFEPQPQKEASSVSQAMPLKSPAQDPLPHGWGSATQPRASVSGPVGAKPDASKPATAGNDTSAATTVPAQAQPPVPAPVVIPGTKSDDLAQPIAASQQTAAPSVETPVAVATESQPKTPAQPLGARAPVTPKADQQKASQLAASWAPTAIPRVTPLDPSLAVAPSSAAQPAPAPQVSQSKSQPAQTAAPDPQQIQIQPDTTSQMVSVPVAQPVSGELAFAVKVTPQEPASPAAESGDDVKPLMTSSAAQVSAVKDSRRAEDDGTAADAAPQRDTAHQAPLPLAAAPLADKPAGPAVSMPEAHTPTPPPTNPADVAQLSQTPEAKPSQPLKQLSIQVGQEQQQRVQVQVVERAGELQVAVRAANPDLAQGLRQGISDLVGQLQQNGFHADAWRPGTPAGAAPAAAEKPQTQAGSQNDNSQSQSGSGQDRQQGNQNPSRRPQWVEELEMTSVGSGESIKGETYGITR
jgi:hypothetical protein